MPSVVRIHLRPQNKLPTAEVAQLVEHQPSKLMVEGSNPLFRSKGSQFENPFLF